MKLNKKLFGIVVLTLLLIPLMSLNVEKVQLISEPRESGLVTNAEVFIYPQKSHNFNLGYMRGNYHDVAGWVFDSTIEDLAHLPLKVMLMTESNYQDYLNDDIYTYTLLSEGLLKDDGKYIIQSTDYYRVVFRNTNLTTKTYAYIYADKDCIEASVRANIIESDSDHDGYRDTVTIHYGISFNYPLPTEQQVNYSIKIFTTHTNIIAEEHLHTSLTSDKSFTYVLTDNTLKNGTSRVYVVVIMVFYEESESPGDDYFSETTERIYPFGHAKYLEDEEEEENENISLPSVVIIIIVSIITIIEKKRKTKKREKKCEEK